MMAERKSRLYVRQSDMETILVNGKLFYVCKRRSKNGNRWDNSAYLYECDLCTHSVDRKGRFVCTYDEEENGTPHQLWCEFAECPYKEDFEQKNTKKKIKSDWLKKILDDFERGEKNEPNRTGRD